MKAVKLTCELDEKYENGYYVVGQKRFPGEIFEVINPNEGQEINIKRSCKVTKSEIEIEENIEIDASEKEKELTKLAEELWEEVEELRKQIQALEKAEDKKPKTKRKRKE